MKVLLNFYFTCLNYIQNLFLLLIRLHWGYAFLQTGLGKFNNWDRTLVFFTKLGIPYPELNLYLASATEVVGGTFLILGLLSRFIAIPLIFTMCIAYITAHNKDLINIFKDPEGFTSAEPFLFLLVSIIILLFGAGKCSLDSIINRFNKK